MATKKSSAFHIGMALIFIGIFSLLEFYNVTRSFRGWWLPIILIIVGILVITSRRDITNILGWVCLVYGVLLLLATLGVLSVTFLWQIAIPVLLILFGLILIL